MKSAPKDKGGLRGKKSIGSIAIALLLVGYAFAQPHLNERFGWSLPGLSNESVGSRTDDQSETVTTRGQRSIDQSTSDSKIIDDSDGAASSSNTAGLGNQSSTQPQSAKSIADAKTDSKSTSSRGPPEADAEDESDALRYGILREIGPDRFMSPQGLQYVPGSAEGHRLEHLRRHTDDQPSRPGKHGVFDGGMKGALKTIDRAYELAKKKQRTTKQVDGNRTIYTVDLGKRVGFVGGREGNRRRKPMARRVKLVLEGNRVITAFPL